MAGTNEILNGYARTSTYATVMNSSLPSEAAGSAQVDSCTRIKTAISFLNTTIPLIWLIVGTVTNGLSLIVFSRKTMRRNSTFFYLAIMTLSDFIVIWICSLRDFLAYKFHIYISGALLCKLHVFVFFVSCQFSSWLLTAANIDRLIYVISYQNAKTWCTKKTAIRVTCIILFILISINFHFLLYVQSENSQTSTPSIQPQVSSLADSSDSTTILDDNGGQGYSHLAFDISTASSLSGDAANSSLSNITTYATINPFVYPLCTLKPGNYVTFYNNYYSWMDAFVFSFCPFIIMLFCNAALIQRVFSTKRNIYRNTRMHKTISSHNTNTSHMNTNRLDDAESQAASRKVSFSPTMDDSHSINHLSHPQMLRSSMFKESTPFLTVTDRSQSTNFLSSSSGTNGAATGSFLETTNLTSTVSTSGNVLMTKAAVSTETTDKMRNLAITIIGVTLLFIIFTLPINIYVPVMASSSDDEAPADPTNKEKKCDDLIFCILNNMVNANHSINFFIYLVTNSKFKKEIELIFDKLRQVLRRNLGLLICCLTCGNIKADKFNDQRRKMNGGGKSQRDMIRMKMQDRGVSMTSFAGHATYTPSRNNSISHIPDELNDKSHGGKSNFLHIKSNHKGLNFRSVSSSHLCAQSNSSPQSSVRQQELSPRHEAATTTNKSHANHVVSPLNAISIPEINYMEPSDDASSNRSPVTKSQPESLFSPSPSLKKGSNAGGAANQIGSSSSSKDDAATQNSN